MEKKAYTFIKNVPGSLTFFLDSYNMQLPRKQFTINHNVESIVVPFAYALGIFVSDDTMQQYKEGYLLIPDFDELRKDAEELGFIVKSEGEDKKAVILKDGDIEKLVLDNDIKGIKAIIDSKNAKNCDTLMLYVRQHKDVVNSGIVKMIEDACGVGLKDE